MFGCLPGGALLHQRLRHGLGFDVKHVSLLLELQLLEADSCGSGNGYQVLCVQLSHTEAKRSYSLELVHFGGREGA